MSSIEKDIRINAHNRIVEINYLFTRLKEAEHPIDKYFLARTTIVFTYGTLEKYIKEVCQLTLKVIIDNNYYNENYVKELMQLLKYQNKPADLFDLLMCYNKTYFKELEYADDKGYFSRNSRMDSRAISHIVNVFNLNRFEPILKIPKLSIDTLSQKRMLLAHGEYIKELERFGPNRKNLALADIIEYVEYDLKLNDKTREEILAFIDDFTNKIVLLINDIINVRGDEFKISN